MKSKIYIIVIFSLSIFLSCSRQEDKDKYQIISLVYEKVMKSEDMPSPLPPLPSFSKGNYNKTQIDSIKLSYLDLRQRLIREQVMLNLRSKKIKRVAIYSKSSLQFFNIKLTDDLIGYKDLLNKYKSTEGYKNIDVSRISTNRKDSIFSSKGLILKGSKKFTKFNISISFSKVVFNKNYDKAIVSSKRTKMYSEWTSIYFLSKTKNGRWVIVKEW
jgi:hypothetical protein